MNAGSMNHGKSSLLNSLLNRKAFAAQDVRTTIKNQSVMWQDKIYLVDTPSLEAENAGGLEKMRFVARKRSYAPKLKF